MAINTTIQASLRESLVEMYLTAKYCIEYRKDFLLWGSCGCYGYPAAIMLFSIADSIGSYVIGGNVEKHFGILNYKDYYALGLEQKYIDILYGKYRSTLVHNATMPPEVFLDIGNTDSLVFELRDGKPCLNLFPFLIKTEICIKKFLTISDVVVENSKQLKDILLKK
jgi:hypothetical protein